MKSAFAAMLVYASTGLLTVASFVVFLVFLILKLTDKIDWSWWCVTIPCWGVGVFGLCMFAAFAYFAYKVKKFTF